MSKNIILTSVIIILLILLSIYKKTPLILNYFEYTWMFVRTQGLRFSHPKHFYNDSDNYHPLPFKQILDNTTSSIKKEANYWELTTNYNNEKRITKIILVNNFDKNKPTLVFHHSAGATDPLRDLNVVLGKNFYNQFNTFAIHAQHHQSQDEYLNHTVDSFLHHQQTFVSSILAIEEILKHHQKNSQEKIVVTGTSMGGAISAQHAFYFGNADYYFPMIAYPNIGEVFLGPAYKTAVKDWEEKNKKSSYTNSYDITDFDPTLTSKVFPILGKKDNLVPYKDAFQFWDEKDFTIKTFPYGHLTPAFAAKEIREYILDTIK